LKIKGGSVLKLFAKALGFIAALVLSGAVGAVGMGGISVTTALGEPLKAEIDLVAVGKADRNKMSARLASPDVFKGAGLDYPSALSKLKFQIEARANGDPYIKVTSAQPVNEPFVSLLVELTWSSGQLLREYTFLLDPPGFKPEQPKAVEVQPVLSKVEGPLEPSVASAGESKGRAVKEEPMLMRATAPMDEMLMRATAPMDEKVLVKPEVAPAKKPAESSNVASGTIKVKHGDTLSKIARETKSPDVSLERMLVAMYRANEDAFDGKNMNRLKTGKILRVPEEGDLNRVAQVEAVKEIHVQAADWHSYRMKLAAASGSVAEQAPKQVASGKISATVDDKAPAAKESNKEVVRLSKGEAPGDKAAGGNAKAMQDKLHAMEEDATARNKALKDSNERIAMLEKNIKEMQRLIELKGQPVPPKPVLSKAVVPETKPENKSEVKPGAASKEVTVTPLPPAALPASAVRPTKPVTHKIETPPPSLLDEILSEPLYLAGGAAALLGLGGIGFMLARRRSKGGKDKEEEGIAGTHIAAPIVPSPDTGDYTLTATAIPISTVEPENVDPISEADLFLNFGRDVQAEEILKDALKKTPGNQQVQLKLLSIYANRKDTKTFSGIARQIQDSGDAAAWAQAAEMGRKMEPGNPMYGGNDGAVVATGEVPLDEVKTEPASLDFDLGFGVPEASAAESNASAAALDVPLDVTTATSSGLDFDLGFSAPTEGAPVVEEHKSTVVPSVPQSEQVDTASVLDFDLGFDVSAEPEAAAPAPAETNYDSTMVLSAPLNEETQAPENLQTAQETPLDLDITATNSDFSAQQPEQVLEQAEKPTPSLDDLVFDVTAADSSPVAMTEEVAAVEAPAEAEDVMAFTLDFPVTEEPPTVEAAPAPAQDAVKETGAIDLSEINLNLDAPASAPAEEVKDARWQDVATKLDLARAYQEMGDASGAREILEEVLNEGDAQQRAAAEIMLQQLSA
jgi:pilus assembly protein FimV